jgi:hypothetical protein
MTIDAADTQRRLKDGVAAAQAGNRVRGRDLLLQVVQAERDNETAWWWLAHCADSAHEQMRALEQVVRLNPAHAEAQAALLRLRQQQVAETPAARAVDWTALLPNTPLEADDGVDDPYQCPYCGRPTGADDGRCPHCRGGLLVRVARTGGASALQLVLLLLGVSLGLGLLELSAPLLALAAQQNPNLADSLGALRLMFGLGVFLGNYAALTPAAAWQLLQLLLVRAGLLLAVLLGLRERWGLAFYAALLALLADALAALYLLIMGQLGLAAAANLLLALAAGVLLFGVSNEFAVNLERILVRPDPTARSALDYYKRGHTYRRQGMWALAVAQWRKAVGLAPQVTVYYKHLGIGYAQIKRFARSLRALEEAQRQAPADAEIAEIIALVRAKAETHTLLKG